MLSVSCVQYKCVLIIYSNMTTKNTSYDKKVFRLFFILNQLDSRKKVSTNELAREFNVSLRTVQRDIVLLNTTGFPIISFEKGFHSFMEGFSLKKMMLTKEEASLLSFLHDISKSLGEKFENSFSNILKKVVSKEQDSAFYVKLPEGAKISKDYPFVKDLEKAVKNNVKIELQYKTPEKEGYYKVSPLKIIFFDGFWYLLAQVDSKELIIKFRLENITNVALLDEYFIPPRNLSTFLDQSVNIWFTEKRDKQVVLKVDKEAASYFKQQVYFPLQKITKENRDGSLRIETKICHNEEILRIIFRWIPYVHVVKPKELKIEVENIVKGYLK
jgi:predicted DNA-binding transcriptional regulator YafY